AGGLDLLEAAHQAGARVACIHPIQSFADVEAAIRNLPDSTFGITASEDLAAWAAGLVRLVGGIPFTVPEANKPLYHAAACMASNYLITLLHMAEEVYGSLGLCREEARRTFWPLVAGTLKNIERSGSVQALTGPISRGDAGTIDRHLHALAERFPGYLNAYCELGRLTVDLALEKKSLSPEGAEALWKILSVKTGPGAGEAKRTPRQGKKEKGLTCV
ncbi:MAG: DUF2520 domain-containing protein, partial [Syntrophaceae bacterium]|nr:DUF2520 domain-containing protein [Syntrophaceae bacterium]